MQTVKKLGMAFACTALVLACMVFAGVDAHAEEASVGVDGAAVVAEALAEAAPQAETPPEPDPAPAPEEAALPAPADAPVDAPDQALSEAAPLAAPEAPAAVAAEAGAAQKVWWQNEDGVMRFYGDDGVVRTGLFEVNGKQYWADATGAAQTGVFWDWPAGSIRYADPMSLELQTGLQWVGSDLYYFDNYLGVQGWTQLDGFDCYFGEYFTAPNGVTEIAGDGIYYFENGRTAGDWFQAVDGEVYFFGGEKGKAVTDFFTVGGSAYYGWTDGRLLRDLFWDWPAGSLRYGDPVSYQLQKGWVDLDYASYYFDNNYLAQRGSGYVDGTYRVFNSEGQALQGIVQQDGGYYYYQHGASVGNWFTAVDGKVYFFGGPGGRALTGLFEVNGKYYFGWADGGYLMSDLFWDWPAGGIRYGDPVSYELLKGWLDMSYGSYYFQNYLSLFGPHTIDGVEYYFDTTTGITQRSANLRGIDVSQYQGMIDWAQVKASGLADFAIIRALTWSNTANYYAIDPYFEHNVREAKRYGIMVGAYLYTYAFNNAEMTEEINFFHGSAEMNKLRAEGIVFDLPVFIDFEWSTIIDRTTYNGRTAMVEHGLQMLQGYGYTPGFYSNLNWATNYYNAAYLQDKGYDFWIANYKSPNTPNRTPNESFGWNHTRPAIWQYTSTGSVSGISGNVDLNFGYKRYTYHPAGNLDPNDILTVYDSATSQVVRGTRSEILARIVAAEVKGFQNAEVYKAQAVAAYSWLLYSYGSGNSTPTVTLGTADNTIYSAVNLVAGQYLAFNNQPVMAMYGASTAGVTNSATAYFSNSGYPYLVSVQDPGGVTNSHRSYTWSTTDMSTAIQKMIGRAPTGDASTWVTPHGVGGYLTGATVAGQNITAATFYENLWQLLSPYVHTFTYNASNRSWTGVTSGNGHGVGMSQNGANYYAKNYGWNYQQILNHYFPGTYYKSA